MTQNYEPMVVRELHAIRREIHAETRGMSPTEKRAFFRNGTEAFFARCGMTPKYGNAKRKDENTEFAMEAQRCPAPDFV